jgi:hypothetical protein
VLERNACESSPCGFTHESTLAGVAQGLVSRVSPVQTTLRNCTRDEGRCFEVGSQVLASNRCKAVWAIRAQAKLFASILLALHSIFDFTGSLHSILSGGLVAKVKLGSESRKLVIGGNAMNTINAKEIERKLHRALFTDIVIPDNIADKRIDEAARKSILALSKGKHWLYALSLLSSVKSGLVSGIHSDTSRSSARLAKQLDVHPPSNLIPKGQDAVFVPSLTADEGSPIIFREHLRGAPKKLEHALSRAVDSMLKKTEKTQIQKAKQFARLRPEGKHWFCQSMCSGCLIGAAVPGAVAAALPQCGVCVGCAGAYPDFL